MNTVDTDDSSQVTHDSVMEHPLYPVFVAAIKQAMGGKGKRHGGCVTPFLEQPWVHYVTMHGRGFATGQAAKKLEEAAILRNGEQFTQEVLGAIVYAGMDYTPPEHGVTCPDCKREIKKQTTMKT